MRSLFFRFNHIIEIATDKAYFSEADRDGLFDVSDKYPNIKAFDISQDSDGDFCFMAVIGDKTHVEALRDSLRVYDEEFKVPDLSLVNVTLSETLTYVLDHWDEYDKIIWGI